MLVVDTKQICVRLNAEDFAILDALRAKHPKNVDVFKAALRALAEKEGLDLEQVEHTAKRKLQKYGGA